jgi:hypothetical protein
LTNSDALSPQNSPLHQSHVEPESSVTGDDSINQVAADDFDDFAEEQDMGGDDFGDFDDFDDGFQEPDIEAAEDEPVDQTSQLLTPPTVVSSSGTRCIAHTL